MIYRIRNTPQNKVRFWRTVEANNFDLREDKLWLDWPWLDVCQDCIEFPIGDQSLVDDLRNVLVSDVTNAPARAFCFICCETENPVSQPIPPRAIFLYCPQSSKAYMVAGVMQENGKRKSLGMFTLWFRALDFAMQTATTLDVPIYLTEDEETIHLGDQL